MSESKVFLSGEELLTEEVKSRRHADYLIHPLFLGRWSPRSFNDRPVPDEMLFTVLEAARWAPSSNNDQPWRFIIARTEEQQKKFQSFIRPSNRIWSDRAPVLVLLASRKLRPNGELNPAHAFDAGAAWGYLSIQAALLGLSTHAMGGFDKEAARSVLNVPDDYELHVVIAVGYRGPREELPEQLRRREWPNERRPLRESVIEGAFPSEVER
ncbi:nitroreductase family protein [Bacillaceae bacterium]